MAEFNRVCKVCGDSFITKQPSRVYCSQECVVEGRRILDRLKRAKSKKKSNALIDIAVEARKHGMSYGQYVALKGL
jgi:hypothetical protein